MSTDIDIDIHPRLSTEKRIAIEKQHLISVQNEKPDKKMEKSLDPIPDTTQSSWYSSTTIIVIIFSGIIVMLILVVVWMVSRSDRHLHWGWNVPQDKVFPKTEIKSAHKNIVDNADAAELEMYANMSDPPVKKPQPEEPAKDEKAQPNKNTDVVIDIEENFNRSINTLGNTVPDTNTESAIDVIVDAEVAKMDSEQHREIEQVSNTTHSVMHTFASTEEISKNGFDISSVLKCCRGERAVYKKCIWRYKLDDVIPLPV